MSETICAIKVEFGDWPDVEDHIWKRCYRAAIDTEPDVFGIGRTLRGAVLDLMDALADLPSEQER